MPISAKSVFFICGAALLLAGCTATALTSDNTASIGAPDTATFEIAGPTHCAKPIGDFKAMIDNDVNLGHLNRPVHERAVGDLKRANATCGAGRMGEALDQLATVKNRYGYH